MLNTPNILLVLALLTSSEPISLSASPAFSYAPATIRLRVIIEPDTRNRAFCVSWEGPYSGSTCRQLDGDKAPRTHWLDLRSLPAGDYTAQAEVQRNTNSVSVSKRVEWRLLEGLPKSQ